MSPTMEFPLFINELVRTHQAFLNYAAIHAHTLELTLPQLDIILTLGHAFGMTFKRLGEKTLITKGTLTGIINRMEHKGLVQRIASKTDGRSQIVRLTTAGQTLFEQAVPEHLDYVNQLFKEYSLADIATLESTLLRLRKAIIAAHGDGSEKLVDGIAGWCAKVKAVCKNHQAGDVVGLY
ncbi:MarR family transcriptional regulator [Methylicorpusculum oleiharenae]|uniref:MarR family winged helix-turn-helix transcriptional regulator n=1 Tax=Methylicorpusculum oleiharenae TaxID=1338687 RepID=UPI001359ABE3|nr:MarR family transcriptional regulator [Methylicorpusculum oleiharenae]MCD2453440.1 MarR family transcriptional regulator [Methylicorpusculum oleiharenae]MDD2661883.1 MarR family transcriptional regulator [Methylococcales bacterium]